MERIVMGQVITDPNDPNWGLLKAGSAQVADELSDPNWGLPNQQSQEQQKPRSTNAALIAATASQLKQPAGKILMELATNQNVPKTAAAIGRVIGGIAPVVGGGMAYGPGGAAVGLAGAAQGAWAGGKTGWFSGKLAQGAAGSIAKLAEKVAPYVASLQPAMGAQGVLDIAQMAEPNRQDIGFLGIGKSENDLGLAWETMRRLIQEGKTPAEAARAAAGPAHSLYPKLMTIYGKDARKGK